MNKTFVDYFNNVFLIIWNIFILSLGITQMVVISQYRDTFKKLDNGCEALWKSLDSSALNVYQSVIILIWYLCIFVGEMKLNKCMQNLKKHIGYQLFGILCTQSIVSIYIVSAYNKTSNFCYNFWIQNAPELWTIATIEYVNLWIVVVVSIISIYKFVAWLFSPADPSPTIQSTVNTNTDNTNHVTNVSV